MTKNVKFRFNPLLSGTRVGIHSLLMGVLSRPAHLQVTQTVGRLYQKHGK